MSSSWAARRFPLMSGVKCWFNHRRTAPQLELIRKSGAFNTKRSLSLKRDSISRRMKRWVERRCRERTCNLTFIQFFFGTHETQSCAGMNWAAGCPGCYAEFMTCSTSRDETVLLARAQHPADSGHVSAHLSVSNVSLRRRALHLSHVFVHLAATPARPSYAKQTNGV